MTSTKKTLKVVAVAATLVAILGGSTGCTLSCSVPAAGQVVCS